MRKLFLIMMTLCAVSWSLMAQTRTLSGTVVDAANNEPLIGATVMPIGGGQGAATDIDGKFTLNVPSTVKQVRVSYVGYKEKVVAVNNLTLIGLESSSTNLQDVVVVAYGTANKESLTGSVAVVGAKEIEDRPVTSVTSALEGNAPGVQVNNSVARPGATPDIRIRGFNSFYSAGQKPLYVVDGVVYQGDIADINPADIESMSVLKDAASCALYGNRGANGVILINTKRAKSAGKVDVTLQVRQGMYTKGIPFYDTLGANEWMDAALGGFINGQITGGKTYANYQEAIAQNSASFVNSYLLGTNIYDRDPSALWQMLDESGMSTGYSRNIQANILPGYTDLDWWDAVSRTGYRQEYNINATGATEKFNAFASIGYLKEQGYMLATDFERFNGRAVVNFNPTSYFKFGANVAATYQKSEVGPVDDSEGGNLNLTTNPFNTFYNPPVQSYYAHDADGAIIYGEDGKPEWNLGGLNKGENVAWVLRLNKNNYRGITFNSNVYGTAVIPYGFELTVRGAMNRTQATQSEYSNNIIGSQRGVGGLDYTSYGDHSYTFMQTLNWSHEYGLNHVDVLLDHENYEYGYENVFLRKSGQLAPYNYGVQNFESNDVSDQSDYKIRTESYLGRVRYNYDQKYFGEFSFRRDGTSRFAKNNRWGNFWSVGASWIITKEKFMAATQSWLDYAKLRFAYGSVGSDALAGAYAYMALYTSGTYDKVGTLIPYQLAANNVKWEATKTLDIALEASLFDNRFSFGVDFFDKRNDDLLYRLTTPASAGNVNNSGANSSVLSNIGEMMNRGWELNFSVDPIRTRDWSWTINLDASFVQNEIKKLPNGRDIPGSALFQGKSLYEKYTYEWAGVDLGTGNSLYAMNLSSPDLYVYDPVTGNVDPVKTQAQIETRVKNAKSTGHYYEIDGKPYTDRVQYAGRRIMGSALPTVYGSFGTNVSWKGINLSMLFTYSLGGKSTDSNYQSLMTLGSTASALHKDIKKAWTEAPEWLDVANRTVLEDGTIVISSKEVDRHGVPQANTVNSSYNDASSSRWLVSNDYLVFKNLNISYDLPKKWMKSLNMQGINVGFSVDNVFTATRLKGFNPQYSWNGGQGRSYVPARVFSFQVTAKF
ncbi:MAG: SusC/RagA family TonB-linked outer membrane protein [Muribaculaceae bacterium]|nr:SusC/RagA family TonB-linked outer membrane protein [Muribaculaceae bacterium]